MQFPSPTPRRFWRRFCSYKFYRHVRLPFLNNIT